MRIPGERLSFPAFRPLWERCNILMSCIFVTERAEFRLGQQAAIVPSAGTSFRKTAVFLASPSRFAAQRFDDRFHRGARRYLWVARRRTTHAHVHVFAQLDRPGNPFDQGCSQASQNGDRKYDDSGGGGKRKKMAGACFYCKYLDAPEIS